MGIFEDTHEQELKLGQISDKPLYGRRKCLYCLKLYWKNSPTQKYCSVDCALKFRSRKDGGKKKKPNSYIKLRFEILTRDNFECKYCGKNPREDDIKLQVDHINPGSKGGEFRKENLITSCNFCNIGKSDVLLDKRLQEKIRDMVKNKSNNTMIKKVVKTADGES